jgi:hypothetical protein
MADLRYEETGRISIFRAPLMLSGDGLGTSLEAPLASEPCLSHDLGLLQHRGVKHSF